MRRTPLDSWIEKQAGLGAALHAYQMQKLRETLAYVKSHSAFYAEKLQGIEPEAIQSPADIAALPFTTPQELAQQGHRMLCTGQGEISRITTLQTTGTTDAAKRVFFTEDDHERTRDFFAAGMGVFTRPGQKVLILLPGETPGGVGRLLAEALARIPAQALPFGVVDAQNSGEAERLILEEGVGAVVGVPWQVLRLAEGPLAGAIKTASRLESVLLTTDYVPDALARRVESAWGCRTYEHYGMTEMGFGGGVSCDAGRGHHLREADLLFEVVDAQTGRPLPPGEAGEVVFTTLTRRGMPLIRYRTGDIAAFSQTPCPCGSALPLLGKIRGRTADTLPLPGGGTLAPAAMDEALYGLEGLWDYAATLRGTELDIAYVGRESLSPEVVLRAAQAALPTGAPLKISAKPGYRRPPDARAVTKRRINT